MSVTAGTFATGFVPRWLEAVRDRRHGGVAERIGDDGRADFELPRTTLTQARTVFSLAHLHLATGDARLLDAACEGWRFLDAHLRDADGGYRVAVSPDGSPLDDEASRIRTAYDQSFALLALVTLRRAAPEIVPAMEIEQLWAFIETLTEPGTGALWQDDRMARAGAGPGDRRGQNPQMHMLEAALQAHEMTGDAVWMERAARYVGIAREHLIDRETGAVREWVGPDLKPLETPEGARREPGHQYEWAWLLRRYADFGGGEDAREMAEGLQRFVEAHGLRRDGGPMKGAPFDALDAEGRPTEETHLLWPLTEAGKLYAARHLATGDAAAAEAARRMERLIFGRFFASDASEVHWHNQLDGAGLPVWTQALSRLVYHVALFVTEGARAGLWPLTQPDDENRSIMQQEETS